MKTRNTPLFSARKYAANLIFRFLMNEPVAKKGKTATPHFPVEELITDKPCEPRTPYGYEVYDDDGNILFSALEGHPTKFKRGLCLWEVVGKLNPAAKEFEIFDNEGNRVAWSEGREVKFGDKAVFIGDEEGGEA